MWEQYYSPEVLPPRFLSKGALNSAHFHTKGAGWDCVYKTVLTFTANQSATFTTVFSFIHTLTKYARLIDSCLH